MFTGTRFLNAAIYKHARNADENGAGATATFPQVASAGAVSGQLQATGNPIDSDDYYGGVSTDVGARVLD
jgi:hypothetical protein